jgi:aminopeptidase N
MFYISQDDLWQVMTEISHESQSLNGDRTIKEIMDTWTLKMGYPVVKVTR